MITILSIICFCLSITGCLLCNRKIIWCWPIWGIAGIIFAGILISEKLYIGSLRELAYVVLSIEGYYRWKYKGKK